MCSFARFNTVRVTHRLQAKFCRPYELFTDAIFTEGDMLRDVLMILSDEILRRDPLLYSKAGTHLWAAC